MKWLLISAAMMVCCTCATAENQPVPAGLPSPESVMARVAENQDRAEAERAHYVYVQHARMASRRGGRVMCEEITDYRMTPLSDGSREELLKLDGRQLTRREYLTYHALPPPPEAEKTESQTAAEKPARADDGKGGSNAAKEAGGEPKHEEHHDSIRVSITEDSMDRDIVENIRWGLIHDKSKDGIDARLFPLTTKEQAGYAFRMIGHERMNGRDVYHITFRPKKKDDFGWSGDAYVDTTAYEPVLITTVMARKIPFAVRTLLGTNVPGLGFTVTYAPQPDGVWFPVTFSTEFKIHVLFFFNRQVTLNAENREFEKTHVTSRMVGEASEVAPQ